MKFTISVLIKKPQSDVFRYLTSPTKLTEWTQGLQSVKSVKGRRNQVGGKSKLLFKEGSTSFTVNEEVLVCKRHNAFSLLLDHKEILTTVDYFLEEADRGTLLTAKYNIKFKNLFNRIFGIFFRAPMKNQQSSDLKKFKKTIERS